MVPVSVLKNFATTMIYLLTNTLYLYVATFLWNPVKCLEKYKQLKMLTFGKFLSPFEKLHLATEK